MNSSSRSIGLVIGAGSIGLQHVIRLGKRYERVLVVDPLAEARDRAVSSVPNARAFATLHEALADIGDAAGSVTAVIANWGPDHAATFDQLAHVGIRRVLCEKPMVHSIAAARGMVERARADGIRLGVNLPRRYSGVVPALNKIATETLDGPIVNIVVEGGAQCLVTMGIHWLDMATALFGALPTGVMARVRDGAINPRSPSLGYWEGTMVWDYPDGRSLTIALSNGSSVSATMHLYARNGRIDVHPDGSVEVGRRREEELQRFSRVTRTGKVVPQLVTLNGLVADPTSVQLDELDGEGPLSFPAQDAAATLEACLAGLWASEAGLHVALPLDASHPATAREWPAS